MCQMYILTHQYINKTVNTHTYIPLYLLQISTGYFQCLYLQTISYITVIAHMHNPAGQMLIFIALIGNTITSPN
jgi:hypothetical protein